MTTNSALLIELLIELLVELVIGLMTFGAVVEFEVFEVVDEDEFEVPSAWKIISESVPSS